MSGGGNGFMELSPVVSVLGKVSNRPHRTIDAHVANLWCFLQLLQYGRFQGRMDSRDLRLVPPKPCARCETDHPATTGRFHG